MEPTDRHPDDFAGDVPDDAALDELLRAARWPGPEAASTRRVAETWARVSPARVRWRIGVWAAAAAAAFVVGLGLAAAIVLRGNDPPREQVNTRPSPAPVPSAHAHAQTPLAPWVIPVLHHAPRAPNPWERAAVLAERRRPGKAPELASAELASAGPLLAALSDPRMASRLAAARALGQYNDPSVTAELVARVERGVGRREALAALLCSGSPDAAAYVDAARRSSALRGTVRSVELQLAHY